MYLLPAQNDVPLAQNDVHLAQNDVHLAQNDVHLAQNDVHLALNGDATPGGGIVRIIPANAFTLILCIFNLSV
jgi:hypothetical protein